MVLWNQKSLVQNELVDIRLTGSPPARRISSSLSMSLTESTEASSSDATNSSSSPSILLFPSWSACQIGRTAFKRVLILESGFILFACELGSDDSWSTSHFCVFDSKEQEKIDERKRNWPLSQSLELYSPAPLSASSYPFLFYIFYYYVCIELLYCRSIVCSEFVLTLQALLRRSFGVIIYARLMFHGRKLAGRISGRGP